MRKGCLTCLILVVLLIAVGVLFSPKLKEKVLLFL